MRGDLLNQIGQHILNGRDARAAAVATMLYKIVYHPQQELNEILHYIELSISYISKSSGVSMRTCHSAWHDVHSFLEFDVVHKYDLPASVHIRRLSKGQTWGRHILITKEAIREAKETLRQIHDLVPLKAKNQSFEWKPLQVSGVKSAKCPYHKDSKASMILNMNADGVTGYGVCMACASDVGGNLVCLIERSVDGRHRCRLTAGTASWFGNAPPGSDSSKRVIVHSSAPEGENAGDQPINVPHVLPTSVWGGVMDHHILGRLNSKGISRAIGKGDFVDILRRANNKLDKTEMGTWAFDARRDTEDPQDIIPDRLLSICRMKPKSWRQIGTGNIPISWIATGQDAILVDLDKAMGVDNVEWSMLPEAILDFTSRYPDLDGRCAVVRTSTHGLQVWLGLQGIAIPKRMSTRGASWQIEVYRKMLGLFIGLGMTEAVIDRSAVGCGRYGRRPAYRYKSSGIYLSRLYYSVNSQEL